MKPSEPSPDDAWHKLVESAKYAPRTDDRDERPSPAFSNRMVASWNHSRRSPLERLTTLATSFPPPEAPRVTAPLGFATRVLARWHDFRHLERYAVWRRWSLAASGCSFAILLLVTSVGASRSDESPIIPIPGLPLPLASN